MNPSEYSEEQLFQKCLELPPEEREAFVETSCGEDEELRDRVLTLLRSHDRAGGFFDSLIDEDSAAIASRLERIAPSEESAGDQIGRYRLLEQIGEGAWGSVWLAQQVEDIDRRVALKILKLGLDTKDFLARFDAERQMLAMMDHPHITKVFDAGATDYGRPYFVMEYVRGLPLVEFADKNRLSIEERVRLFIKVCRALHHAHVKGIVHRDLKPSNILISKQDADAFPKVIDFGVAKTTQFRPTDKTLFTSIHTYIGTPVYSSPEQIEFTGTDVGTRSDIYSLGVLLYELLCGRIPFDYQHASEKGIKAFRTIVREKDPPRPSMRWKTLSQEEQTKVAQSRHLTAAQVEPLLKGKLDWIVLKCVEKDPSRRYESADLLANDLQAYLDDHPTSATAPTAANRIRKILTPQRRSKMLLMGIPTLVFGVFALFLFLRSDPSGVNPDSTLSSSSGPQASEQSSIAVLPLINMSADEDNVYFADGVHKDILANLARIDGLEIVSRTTMLRYAVSELTLREIGKVLNVGYILQGSVRRIANHVRVSVQLIDAVNDRQVWDSSFERELKDVFAAQSAFAKEISNSIHLKLQPDTVGGLADMPTSSALAYDLYLKSIGIEKTEGETESSTLRRRDLLEQAVQVDPDFVEGWAVLKRVYALMARRVFSDRGWYIKDPREKEALVAEYREKERQASAKAMALDPEHPDTLLAKAVDNDWPKSEAELREMKHTLDLVIEKDPDNAMAWYHLGWYYWTGLEESDNAMDAFEEALSRDPFNARIVGTVLSRYRQIGDQENVDRMLERKKQIIPDLNEERWGGSRAGDWFARLHSIKRAFQATSDETYIERYKEVWVETESERPANASSIYYLRNVALLTNDMDGILKITSEPTFSKNLSTELWECIFVLFESAVILLERDQEIKAREHLRRIIEIAEDPRHAEELGLQHGESGHQSILSILASTHSLLGNPIEATRWLDVLIDGRSKSFDPQGASAAKAMAWIDPERAATMMLDEILIKPQWGRINIMAQFFLIYRPILVQPKIVEYYVNEHPRWIPYLAQRLPVYEEYQRSGK